MYHLLGRKRDYLCQEVADGPNKMKIEIRLLELAQVETVSNFKEQFGWSRFQEELMKRDTDNSEEFC